MNAMARKALLNARKVALTDYVIEWGGKRVLSVKKGVAAAARRAEVKCTPHVLRHTAACLMAEAGIRMEEIAQYLGHTNTDTTRRVYARYSPEYLRDAAKALEL
jgi:integrase